MAANDKKRQLVITEVRPSGSGTFTELNTRFVWDAASQSSHRGAWEYELGVRTVREDYAGTDRPTEQVLGWNWEPFTMAGWWDNRWAAGPKNDANFAENTRIAFEQMVQRGNLVKIEFESLSVIGIIKKLKITYRTHYRIGWEFTVSPHNHGDDVVQKFAPQKAKSPNSEADDLQALVDKLKEIRDDIDKTLLTGDLFDTVSALVDTVNTAMDTVTSVITNRVFLVVDPVSNEPVNSVARVAGAFNGLHAAAEAIPAALYDQPIADALAFQPGVGTLNFQVWSRELPYLARVISLESLRAQQRLLAQVSPDALALYNPRAGESLYGISNRFYNTPHRWRDIAVRNNLKVLTMEGTELLVIPGSGS